MTRRVAKPTAQLHNSSSQPKPVECGRVTQQRMSLNGYSLNFFLAMCKRKIARTLVARVRVDKR
jgi:hypothetical protein